MFFVIFHDFFQKKKKKKIFKKIGKKCCLMLKKKFSKFKAHYLIFKHFLIFCKNCACWVQIKKNFETTIYTTMRLQKFLVVLCETKNNKNITVLNKQEKLIYQLKIFSHFFSFFTKFRNFETQILGENILCACCSIFIKFLYFCFFYIKVFFQFQNLMWFALIRNTIAYMTCVYNFWNLCSA